MVENDLANIPLIVTAVKKEATQSLRDGLRYQNHSAVGNALQVSVLVGGLVKTAASWGTGLDGSLRGIAVIHHS